MNIIELYCHYQAVHKLHVKTMQYEFENLFNRPFTQREIRTALVNIGYKVKHEFERIGENKYKKHTYYVHDEYMNENTINFHLKDYIKCEEHFHLIFWLKVNTRRLMSYTDVEIFWPEYNKAQLIEIVNRYFETIPARAKNLHNTIRSIVLINNGDMLDLERCSNKRDFGMLYDLIVLPNQPITPRYYGDQSVKTSNKLKLADVFA